MEGIVGMNVLILSHHFYPFIGGLEEVAFQQARHLAMNGHDVNVITSNISNELEELPKEEEIDGVKIYRISAMNFLYKNFDIPQPVFNIFELRNKLNNLIKTADVVHIHDRHYMTSFMGSLMAKKHKKPVVLTLHTPRVKYGNKLYNFLFQLNEMISSYSIKKADAILSLGSEVHDYILERFGRESEIVWNGVDIDTFSPVSEYEKIKLRADMKLPEEKFIALFVGRLTFKKGADLLVEVAKNLRDHEDVEIIVVGDGPRRKVIEKNIKNNDINNIKLIGNVVDKRILSKFYRAADILLFTSRGGEAAAPLVLLEAMASSLPIVALRTGPYADLISKDKGYAVSTINEMSDKIIYLSGEADLMNELSLKCRKYAEKYSWSKNVDELLEIYSNLTK